MENLTQDEILILRVLINNNNWYVKDGKVVDGSLEQRKIATNEFNKRPWYKRIVPYWNNPNIY